MAIRGAVPGAGYTRTAVSTALDTGSDKRGEATLTRLGLPRHVIGLLHDEGVDDLHDWRRLGKRRFQIFGITTKTAKVLDRAAREARL